MLFLDNWRDFSASRDSGQLVGLLGATTKVSETLSPERGATSVALDGKAAARQTLAEARVKVDAAFDAVESVARAANIAEGPAALATLTKIRADLTALRAKADAVTGGDPDRIAATRKDFIAGMYELVNATGNLTALLERKLAALDPDVAAMASLAVTTWNLRDNAGRLSTMHIVAITSGKPFSTEQWREINVADGRVQQLWDRLNAVAGAPDSPPSLREGLAKIEAGYTTPFKSLRQRVTVHGLGDGAYDLDPAEWRRLSAPMLQSIMAMRDTAIDEANRVVAANHSRATTALMLLCGLLAVAVATLTLVAVGINRRIIGPLAGLTAIINSFANGSRDFTVPFADRDDETGQMAKAVEILRDKAREADALAARATSAAQARDERRQRVEGVTNRFVESIDAVVQGVSGAIDGLRSATVTLSGTSATTTEQASVVASAADQASSNVQTVAAAAEELSHSIHEISRRVSETAEAMDGAVREAENTDTTVRGLAEAARRIGDVVNLITDIAAQTNLLALHATIEAARAGDAGKGFAVVAGEVKTLANQTARATDDIQAQVSAIQAETERAVAAIAGIGSTIARVNQYTIGIASAVEQQGAATQEIARNVQQAAAGTSEVSHSIGKVLEAERQTGIAAAQLSGLADRLAGESQRLRGDVGNFVAEVKKG
jgi:methyl-accepting chemotaxis protein